MTERELGRSGLKVSAVGLGCMGMSDFYDPQQRNDDESVRVIHRPLVGAPASGVKPNWPKPPRAIQ
jgi:hypothetical protein